MSALFFVLLVQLGVCGVLVLARRGARPDRAAEAAALLLMLMPLLAAALMAVFPLSLGVSGASWTGALPGFLPDHGPAAMAGAKAPAPVSGAQVLLPVLIAGYGLGAGVELLRLWRGWRRLRLIERRAVPVPALGTDVYAGPGVPGAFASGRGVFLPQSMLRDPDLALVLLHERRHRAQGDPRVFLALSVLDALFWGHPFIRWQTARYRLAAELSCDAAVTAAVPQKRRAYAALLLAEARKPAGHALASVPAVISQNAVGDITMRLSSILSPAPGGGKRPVRLILAGLALIPALGIQAVALGQGAGGTLSVRPVEGRLTSPYGMRTDPNGGGQKFHNGVDIAAPLGTPLRSPGAGRIKTAAEWGRYGLLVEIDHGDGVVTRFSQLDDIRVRVGQRVAAGDVFATLGSSGLSTGPHMHVEVFVNGERVDPASMLDLPGNG